MNILQKIFKEHYEEMVYILHPRASVIENVEKMINCGDPSFGGAMYGCPTCGKMKFVPFRCHSRFCPTCGNKYSIPEKHFKMIRYGGIYARHREIDKKLVRAISREKHPLYCGFNKWRAAILHAFGYHPLQCPECGSTMLFLELYYRHKRVSLKDMYEKVMSVLVESGPLRSFQNELQSDIILRGGNVQ